MCDTCPHQSNIACGYSGAVFIDGIVCQDGVIHPCHEDVSKDCAGHKIEVTLPYSDNAAQVMFRNMPLPRFPVEPELEGLN